MASGNTTVIQNTLTTTTADTFIQATIGTGLTGSDTSAFRIKELIIEYPFLAANNAVAEYQLTRGTKVGMASWSDTSLIFKNKRALSLTTSGAVLEELVVDFVPQGDLIIVEQQIYLGFKTTSTGGIATLGYKLVLEEIKISQDQRIGILSNRLP